ncbi:ABC transporter ATP-binding protein/permease [Frankia sp. Cpl3]|uniref:ABC transporter ATP-binding protein n=1 Tax=Parafrankia colletiae TaxID=573497 RepID=UPI000A0312E7|nr:ABC transporter ATP-binding protein [Parafrankia colletiae]MCK9899730.1 ABC transporter ATP-binding protein/permease [Frankia sp. Cpl3]
MAESSARLAGPASSALNSGDEEEQAAAPSDRRNAGLHSFLAHIWTFRWRAVAVLGVFAIANLLLAVVPIFAGRLVAALAATPVDRDAALFGAGVLIGFGVLHDIFWRSAELLWVRLILDRGYEYEDLVFTKVITQPYPYFVGTFTGKISSYAGTLGREYRMFLNSVYWEYCGQVVRLPTLAAIMFTVNVPTGFAFAGGLALMLLLGRLTVQRVAARERAAADVASDVEGHTIDVIANFVAVKSFTREAAESAGLRARRRGLARVAASSYRWNFLYFGAMSVVVRYVLWPTTILFNLHLYLNGNLTLAQFATFLTALMAFSEYIWGTVWFVSQLNLQLARVEEAYRYLFGARDIIDEHRRAAPREETRRPPVYTRSLRIDNLRFAYPDDPARPVLDTVSLDVARNEKIGIVGRSGSGKSTLLKLLLGYYPLPPGTLRADGAPIDDRQLARLISYVPQDITLFHRSIRDNIVYGTAATATSEEVEDAARRAHAHEFITSTRDGYDTLVGERGIRLSTGQRQRIALARAFLSPAPILVLDEATSALDSESERLVQDALEDLWAGRTVIAIAHRLSTLLTMDRIVVLEGGRIAEQGSHEELLTQSGLYHHLWNRQSGGLIGGRDLTAGPVVPSPLQTPKKNIPQKPELLGDIPFGSGGRI